VSKKLKMEILDWAVHLVAAIILGFLIIIFVGRLTIVEGNSMSPTLQNNNILIIESITQRLGTIEQGDIVVLKIPELLSGRGKYAIKRVIAKENQHVIISDGKVYVDGIPLQEDYISTDETLSENSLYADIVVPEGCIFVLGDNRIPGKSSDSRYFGPVNEDRIVGRAWVRIYPFTDAGIVK
jgi:signal peptidase I